MTMKTMMGVKSVRIGLSGDDGLVLKNIAALFARQIQQRCSAKVAADCDAALTVELTIERGIGAEGFTIADGEDGTIRIMGNDERGVLYGVGKFLRTSRYGRGGFTAGTWRGTSAPEKPVRGIYLATHFHNFYQVAPITEVRQYVEDVALWGYNVLLVWYPMHIFSGFNDPAAVEYRKRLRAILQAAHAIGLDVAWGALGNEGYRDSPAAIRAVKCAGKGAQFACDICPSQPGGTEYILTNSTQLLREFAELRPKHYFIWPYDNGGCDCEKCRPWGANGYLRMAGLLAEQHRKLIPEAKIILSTWLFSPDEWLEIQKMFSVQPPQWADYMVNEWLSDATRPVGVPGGLPALGFPEITMIDWKPWGGYGAAPLPARFQAEWRDRSRFLSGGYPYSEGIYDDVNKALFAQFYWDSNRPAADIVKEYSAFEYSPDVADDLVRAIGIFERNHKRQEIDESAEEAFRLIQKTEAKLTLQARQAWRWRIVALRALIDRELFRIVPRPVFKQRGAKGSFMASIPGGEVLHAAFEELRAIYQAGKINRENVDEVWLLPPLVLTDK